MREINIVYMQVVNESRFGAKITQVNEHESFFPSLIKTLLDHLRFTFYNNVL